jgi:KaiC/GvpD/RAD55 family RecA-like ATPase
MRVFERSIHGGLGKGNIGLVMSHAGTGRTPFLVGVALDDLLRDRKVLHISTKSSHDRIREFYEEIFHDLAEVTHLEDRLRVRLQVERNRMIHTFLGQGFTVERLVGALDYMSKHVQFDASTIILEGYPDWENATTADLEALRRIADRFQCEMWLEGQVHREGEETDSRGIPPRIARFEDYIAVMLRLQTAEDHVRLQLIKDHDNADLADVHVELDPRTLLLVWR